MKEVIVTGGCGFVGHHLVEHILKNTEWKVKIFDKLTYASNGFDRLRDINIYPAESDRIEVFAVDISKEIPVGIVSEVKKASVIFHLAAESHVDNSIVDPIPFIETNVLGTAHMLNLARKLDLEKFFYFSTDEVFGPAPPYEWYKEWDRYNSSNPYAATKAGGEELALAYSNTYKVPVVITHTMNCFGERQHPEKYIPLCIRKILNGEKITVHASPYNEPGKRHYIHCRNVADALLFLEKQDDLGLKFNIVGEREIDNLELAFKVGAILNKDVDYELVDFHSSRPGHDLRYALDGSLIDALGWKMPKSFNRSLDNVVGWYLMNPEWLQA